jgi:hypothetical protein
MLREVSRQGNARLPPLISGARVTINHWNDLPQFSELTFLPYDLPWSTEQTNTLERVPETHVQASTLERASAPRLTHTPTLVILLISHCTPPAEA